ncbi:hypothetical protein AB1A65_16090 [Muricauda sp. ANG21]|uniref:hypothetical protein n=1 Tax=Allomuricauda sp. ANG21 TaxID=3042468 RepID=UPI0034514012
MNGKRLGIEVVLSVIYWVFASRFFHITEIELKIKDYDIFGTLQSSSLGGFSLGGSIHLFGNPAHQKIVEVAILIGDDPYRAYPRHLVCTSSICHF